MTYHKEGYSLHRNVDQEKAEGAEVISNVKHRALDMMRLNLLVLLCSYLGDESRCSNLPLPLIQGPEVLRARGHNKGRKESHNNSKKPFKEENVSPRMNDHG